MAKVSNKPLQPNPFLTYRDPETGTWIVVIDNTRKEPRSDFQTERNSPLKLNKQKKFQ